MGFRSPIWIRGILKSVAFSALCARKLAELANSDVHSEVVCGQRLTTNFVVSSVVVKSFRFKLRNRGLQVRVLPGVFQSPCFSVLFVVRRRDSFVAPSGILSNPHIGTGFDGARLSLIVRL